MSAISPFIRVLRAEADAMADRALAADDPATREAIEIVVGAKRDAASRLEAEECELTERIDGR